MLWCCAVASSALKSPCGPFADQNNAILLLMGRLPERIPVWLKQVKAGSGWGVTSILRKMGTFHCWSRRKKHADLNFYQLTLEVKGSNTYIPPNLLPDFFWVGHLSTKSKKTYPGDELVRLMLACATWVAVEPIPPLWRWGCMVVDCWRKSWTCSRFEEVCWEPRKGFKDCLLVCF